MQREGKDVGGGEGDGVGRGGYCSAYHRSIPGKSNSQGKTQKTQRTVSVSKTPKFIRLNPKRTSRSDEKGLGGAGRE